MAANSFRAKIGNLGVHRITIIETVAGAKWSARAEVSAPSYPPGKVTVRVMSGINTGQSALATIVDQETHIELRGKTPFK